MQVGVRSSSGGQKRSGDYGIDVIAKNGNQTIGIQVKHWKENVGFNDVAKTVGVSGQYDKVIIISTKSDFTQQTYEAIQQNKFQTPVALWDSRKFKSELRTHVLPKVNEYKRTKSSSTHGTLPKGF